MFFMKSKTLVMFATTTGLILTIAASAQAGTCYGENDRRDKWLAGWVYWIPEKGSKATAGEKEYSQMQAIRYAKKDIPKGFEAQNSDVNSSPAGLAALAMIAAKNDATKTVRKYNRSIKRAKFQNGAPITVSFEDAAACWTRFK